MGIFIAAAAAAIALGAATPGVSDAVVESAHCLVEVPLTITDTSAAPLLVSAVGSPQRPSPVAAFQDAWGQSALRPYDVMSSLGSGGAPALPSVMSLADAPPPLPMSSPLAWMLAGVGLLGMLYVRRTHL